MRVLGIAILCGILCLFDTQAGHAAEITVVDNSVFVRTDTYKVQFVAGAIAQLHNNLTGETYTRPISIDGAPTGISGHTGLLRKNDNAFWTDEATQTEIRKIDLRKAEVVFSGGTNEVRLFISVDEATGDLLIEQEGVSETAGVYGIQWGCGNLDTQRLKLILPTQGGQTLDATSPMTSDSFEYPEHWEAQLAIVQSEKGGFFVRGEDETLQFKALHYEKDIERFALGFETQNQAPFDALTASKSITWRLNTYVGDWRVPARQYRDWMEQTFKPKKLTEIPAWGSEIGLVVIYHGLELSVLEKLAEHVNPAKTLLYLTQWRKDDYDTNYPDYTASEDFGGFLETARGHGFRVMLHTNLPGVAPSHPLYAELQQHQFRDRWNGNRMGWFWGRPDEPGRHAFINPASPEFRRILVSELADLSQKYPIDAIHLDVSLIARNDANGLINGLNAAQGNVQLHTDLTEALPWIVFGGEGLHEVTFFRESLAQRLVYRLDIKPHPISTFLFSPYTLLYGHLGLPNPDMGPQLYEKYLLLYERWGILPTLRLWSAEQLDADHPETQRLLAIAKVWQAVGFKPDFETDWAPETLFQYVGSAGEVATLQGTDTRIKLMLPENTIGYERISGVTQIDTDRNLRDWRAYNETTLLGLNPEKSYLLSDAPRDFSQLRINDLPEGVAVTAARVTENAALFRLEWQDISAVWGEPKIVSEPTDTPVKIGFFLPNEPIKHFPEALKHQAERQYSVETALPAQVLLFFQPPQQVDGTYNLREAAFVAGLQFEGVFRLGSVWGSGERMTLTANGVTKKTISAHPPPNGQTVLQFLLSLPDAEELTFNFSMGLPDKSCSLDGLFFKVFINGAQQFEHFAFNTPGWTDAHVSLSEFAGETVLLELVTDSVESATCDWGHWANLLINFNTTR